MRIAMHDEQKGLLVVEFEQADLLRVGICLQRSGVPYGPCVTPEAESLTILEHVLDKHHAATKRVLAENGVAGVMRESLEKLVKYIDDGASVVAGDSVQIERDMR